MMQQTPVAQIPVQQSELAVAESAAQSIEPPAGMQAGTAVVGAGAVSIVVVEGVVVVGASAVGAVLVMSVVVGQSTPG
jgi:hypothetical protein